MRRAINNPSFIGIEEVNKLPKVEEIKHPVSINEYNFGKTLSEATKKTKTNYTAFDIETDINTNEIKLIGYCDYNPKTDLYGYVYFYFDKETENDFMEHLALLIDNSINNNGGLCYWNDFDYTQLLNLFYKHANLTDEEIVLSCRRIASGISGVYNSKEGIWTTEPIVKTLIDYKGGTEIGIKRTTANCLTLYIKTPTMKKPSEMLVNCVANHYRDGLKKTAESYLDWNYEKGEEETHVVDWDKFKEGYDFENGEKHSQYVESVLLSNYYDCKAAKDLMENVEELFHSAFNYYPKNAYTGGSLTKAAIAIILTEKKEIYNAETKEKKITEKLPTLNIYEFLESQISQGRDKEDLRKAYAMAIDAYSAGQIDVLVQGYTKKGYVADITSSYPMIIATLLNLENAEIVTGGKCKFKDVPKPSGSNYVFVTAKVNLDIETVSTLTVKQLWDEDEDEKNHFRENARPWHEFIACGLYDEFEFVKQQQKNAVVEVLEWVEIKTEGKPSPFVKVVAKLWKLRDMMIKNNDPSQLIIKTIINSLYGIMYEGYANFGEFNEDIYFTGTKTGAFFNPIYATIVTGFARLRLAEARLEIQKNGGTVLMELTDCLIWEGEKDNLPETFDSVLKNYRGLQKNGWKKEKTIGYYEEPKEVHNLYSLGIGTYEYQDPETKKYTVKTMGYPINRTKEELTKPFLMEKTEETFTMMRKGKKKEYTNEYGSPVLILSKSVVIKPGDIASDTNSKAPFQLGSIETTYDKLAFTNIEPKREYDSNYFINPTLKDFRKGLVPTIPPAAAGIGAGFDRTDARLLDYRKKFTGDLVKEKAKKGTKKEKSNLTTNQKKSLLIQQIKENLPEIKITVRQRPKIDYLRQTLLDNHIEPVV